MRNAVLIDKQYAVTIDNSGCIGEKELDAVKVPNEVAAYFTARVGLLEQWCAGSHPTHILLANFTGDVAWQDYEKGITRAFEEIGEKVPPISGSTESNFQSLQSGLSITMFGKVMWEYNEESCDWFVIGKPLVGQEVLEQPENVAKLNEIHLLIKLGIVQRIWPTGSKGIGAELEKLFKGFQVECSLPLDKSAGPSTCVIVAVKKENVPQFMENITSPIEQIKIVAS